MHVSGGRSGEALLSHGPGGAGSRRKGSLLATAEGGDRK